MRILKVTQSYHPFLEKGGQAVKVHVIARELARRGHQVTVLTADLGLERAHVKQCFAVPVRWGWRAEESGTEAIYLRTRARYRGLTWNPSVLDFCRQRSADFDLAHIYGLYDLLGPTVAFFCRRRALPYVVEPIGMYRPIVRNLRLKRLYHSLLGNQMLRGARQLIATSEQERQELIEGGVPEKEIVVRRNGIESYPTRFPSGEHSATDGKSQRKQK